MKRSKEIYKLGRKIMNACKVPMKRTYKDKGDTSEAVHTIHYHKDSSMNVPSLRSDGTWGNKSIKFSAGQVRMRRAKTADEVSNYYGSAINNAINSTFNSLENDNFDGSVASSYASSVASSASSNGGSIAPEVNERGNHPQENPNDEQ